MAGWPQVKILACKMMDAKGVGYTSKAADCIGRCASNGARVIQASWSGPAFSQTLKDAIQWAGTKGVLFVSSAGNKAANLDKTPSYPASFGLPNQLVVASSA
jgi:subtilisin family serine protease